MNTQKINSTLLTTFEILLYVWLYVVCPCYPYGINYAMEWWVNPLLTGWLAILARLSTHCLAITYCKQTNRGLPIRSLIGLCRWRPASIAIAEATQGRWRGRNKNPIDCVMIQATWARQNKPTTKWEKLTTSIHSRILYKLVATIHTFFHFILQPLDELSATTASGKYYHAPTAASADTSMGGFKGMKVINLPHVHKPWTHPHWIHTSHSLQCSKHEVAHTYLSLQIPHDKEWQT